MGTRYHVVVDGQGYLLALDSYKRSRGAGRTPPRWWTQTDWRRGMGGRRDRGTAGRGEGASRGYGVEIGRDGLVALAPGLGTPVAVGEAGSVSVMRVFAGSLYGVSGASPAVRKYAPGGWTSVYSAGAENVLSFGDAFGELMIGGSDGKVHSYDPYAGLWGLRFTRTAGRPVTALAGCGWWDTVDKKIVPRLAVALSRTAPSVACSTVEILSADGAVTSSFTVLDPVVVSMCEYERRLMVLSRGQGPSVGGTLLDYDSAAEGNRGNIREVAAFADGTPTCMLVAAGLLWIGMSNGRVLATNRERVVTALDLAELGFSGAIAGMCEYAGRLRVAFSDAVLGSVVAVRMPSEESGAPRGIDGAADGWCVGSYSGTGTDVSRSIAGYDGALHVAVSRVGGGYSLSPAGRVAGGEVVGLVVGGDDLGAVKDWLRAVVAHSALAAGESVSVYYSAGGPGGPWTLLGTTAGAGSTSVSFDFPVGAAGRLLWLRVALAGPGASSPTLRALTLELSVQGDGRRRWGFVARCEGGNGRPLRLLDGAVESKSGVQLSAALAAAAVKAAVAFEDLDGVAYSVRCEGMEEDVGRLQAQNGCQTAAAVKLVEV